MCGFTQSTFDTTPERVTVLVDVELPGDGVVGVGEGCGQQQRGSDEAGGEAYAHSSSP